MYRAERNVLPLFFIGFQEEPMELVACSCHAATMNERRRLVTTDAAVSPRLSGLDAEHSTRAAGNINALLVNGIDDCTFRGFSAPPVLIVPDGTVVLYA
jgi:hypothetical protein